MIVSASVCVCMYMWSVCVMPTANSCYKVQQYSLNGNCPRSLSLSLLFKVFATVLIGFRNCPYYSRSLSVLLFESVLIIHGVAIALTIQGV